MRHTVVGVFDSRDTAEKAAREMDFVGVAASRVHLSDPWDDDAGGPRDYPSAGSPSAPHAGSMISHVRSFLAEVFGGGAREQLQRYASAFGHGHTVLRVDVDDDADVEAVRMALQRAGALDIGDTEDSGAVNGGTETARAEASPVQVQHFGEPVMSAGAQDVSAVLAGGAELSAEDLRRHFEVHYESHYESLSAERDLSAEDVAEGEPVRARFEDYEPAYRYGHALRDDARFRERAWMDIEPQVREDWLKAHPGSEWERFKDAVRRGFGE